MNTFYLIFFLFIFQIISEPLEFKKVESQDIIYKPYTDEGYIQGWNFYFKNKEFTIFTTFAITNLGPGDFHSGIALNIYSKKTNNLFFTNYFQSKHYITKENFLYLKILDNTFQKIDSIYELYQNYGDTKIHLIFYPYESGVSLSGGNFNLGIIEKFVRADIPFSFAPVKGTIELNGERIDIEGIGGMEHILTNYEIYKFSKSWNILRTISKDGISIYSGGYSNGEKENQGFYRTVLLQSKSGEIIFSGIVLKVEVLESFVDSYSGYTNIIKEKLYLSNTKNCTLEIHNYENEGKINILEHVPSFIKLIIRLFFTNPYQYNYSTSTLFECKDKISEIIESKGLNSYYLINK